MACNSNFPNPCIAPPCDPSWCCPSLVGPTGPNGPSSFGSKTPAVFVAAVLNTPSILLVPLTIVTIPFNLSVGGNVAGNVAFDYTAGIFNVPITGFYKVDYTISFLTLPTLANAITGGTGLGSAVLQNQSRITNPQFVFPTTVNSTLTINESFSGSIVETFRAGDKISVIVLTTMSLSPTSITGASVDKVPPFNTILNIRSLF